MSDEKHQIPASAEPKQGSEQELDAEEDAMAYVALRGAVKPDDLSLWEIQELCQAFLRHVHRKRSE